MLDRLIGERYRQHRYNVGRREGRQEGRTETLAEAQAKAQQGIAEAKAEAQQTVAEAMAEAQRRLDEWNARRLAAQAAGEPFAEPPPSVYPANGNDGRAADDALGGQGG